MADAEHDKGAKEDLPGDERKEGLTPSQKKRLKKKAKKKEKAEGANEDVQNGSSGDKDKELPKEQSDPPTIPVSKLFPEGNYPQGEVQSYRDDNRWRETSEEKRHQARLEDDMVRDVRKAAEVHREARDYAYRMAQPGVKLMDLCENLESSVRSMIEARGLEAGLAFPTGVSLNNIAAHWTPNPGDDTLLKHDDVMKVDFGTHVNGRIIDSAFTVAHNRAYDPLLEAAREATNTGIKEAGIDSRLGDVGAAIQEVMESYEVELDGRSHQVNEFMDTLCSLVNTGA